ncbi:PP2C family protein-serine/threonine phosphatase [Sphingomonas hankyongi]|uniref:Protein phosphatase 2C domain-containing protein n=1 Tax=Sphingomonas hankyongi TaxID=2908209 RepID=A0ABT0RYY0_9SPHN|nr:protein phosphatase 2C domain-containing protein [Sphingomonas hankyongi]MCL6728820.1 protein phosphatase 2C domain-containing protein [Sphingomonas hankyongi]
MRFECVSRTHVGLKRKINEDSILVETPRGLWAVADGMGGHEAGEVASAMVAEALRNLPSSDNLDEFATSATDSLRRVNDDLIRLAQTMDSERTIGTTVVALAIDGDRFRCLWAGDSRAYWLRGGQIMRISRDHSLVQDLVDVGMLKPEEAEGHENANVITRAVGVRETLELDSVSGDARPGDLFLLASDGLTRLVDDQEIAAEITRGSLDEAADNLIEKVLERGAPDNVSLIIVRQN